MTNIHKTAVIDPKAELADDVSVGPYAVIGANVTIGSGTSVGAHTVIEGPTIIGERNQIFPHAAVGFDPQDLKYDGSETLLTIGDDNRIREFSTINRGMVGSEGATIIGNNNLIMAYVHIGHACQVGNHIIFSNAATLAGHVTIGDYALLSGFAKVHQFCRIGDHAMLGMGASINRDVPPYTIMSNDMSVPSGINAVGLKRKGFDEQQRASIKQAYKWIYRDGLKLKEAIGRIRDESLKHPELGLMADFLEQSERSIMR